MPLAMWVEGKKNRDALRVSRCGVRVIRLGSADPSSSDRAGLPASHKDTKLRRDKMPWLKMRKGGKIEGGKMRRWKVGLRLLEDRGREAQG